jgi:AraC-like DNA-binding protein
MHPDWPYLDVVVKFAGDPLNIKKFVNPVTAMQITLYVVFSLKLLATKTGNNVVSLIRTNDEIIRSLRNMVLHFLIIILIFIAVKIRFSGDLGDYMIGIYISLIILITTFRVMNDSTYFDRSTSFMDIYHVKYTKSSLTESRKEEILKKISTEFENKKYYSENLASLSDLAKRTGESPHHVSQVINEKLNMGFFELLAKYRIDEAKKLICDKKNTNLTIEEISEIVGYNSKTAFNNSFKKLTGKTPSEFRKNIKP